MRTLTCQETLLLSTYPPASLPVSAQLESCPSLRTPALGHMLLRGPPSQHSTANSWGSWPPLSSVPSPNCEQSGDAYYLMTKHHFKERRRRKGRDWPGVMEEESSNSN